MSIESRIVKLENHVEAKDSGIKWVAVCWAGEKPPSDAEWQEFERLYIQKYGEPEKPVDVNCFNGRIQAGDIVVPFQGGEPAKKFDEVRTFPNRPGNIETPKQEGE